MDSDEVARRVSQSGTELVELRAAVRQLQARVDRQSLAIQVLKDMLQSQPGFSEDEFLERLHRAAARKADDKTCRKCGKPMSAKHSRCMYCGEQRPPELL
jgi:predicted component of type VI protein secretion system